MPSSKSSSSKKNVSSQAPEAALKKWLKNNNLPDTKENRKAQSYLKAFNWNNSPEVLEKKKTIIIIDVPDGPHSHELPNLARRANFILDFLRN